MLRFYVFQFQSSTEKFPEEVKINMALERPTSQRQQ